MKNEKKSIILEEKWEESLIFDKYEKKSSTIGEGS